MKAFRWRDFLSLPVGKNLCLHDGHVTVVPGGWAEGRALQRCRLSLILIGVAAAGASMVASCSLFVLLDDGWDRLTSVSAACMWLSGSIIVLVSEFKRFFFDGHVLRSLGGLRPRFRGTEVSAGIGLGFVSVGCPSMKCWKFDGID